MDPQSPTPSMNAETPGGTALEPRSRFRSLYLHFPFCETKCHYCDFYSIGAERTGASDPALFIDHLVKEASLWRDYLADRIDTIFLGGGTPSMTPPSDMARVFETLGLASRVHADTEWTMEANPSSISLEKMRAYRELGINRVSMGVQAMRDDLLARLGRVHDSARAIASLETLFEAGFTNVSVDLLCGVPGQSLEILEEALTRLTAFPITHLSCYLLTLPKSHRMFRELPDEEEQLRHLALIDEWMTARGFRHYEISNFAKPGREARHNLAYWKGEPYLALGPSGHSFDPVAGGTGQRWKNVSSLHAWASRLARSERPVEWVEALNEDQKALERWMLALRLDEGFPESWLDTERRRSKAAAFIRSGWMERHPAHPERLRLTPAGMPLSDALVSELS